MRQTAIAVVVATLAIGLYLPMLGYTELELEAPRRAVIARTMIATGDYLVPRFEGRPYLKKPPLYNWAIAAVSLARGRVDEVAARLPSVLSIALLAALMVVWTRGILGPWGQALVGVGVVLVPIVGEKARLAEIEPLFMLLVTAALWTWFRLDRAGRAGAALWVLPAVLAGLAFLTKREPALLFFYLATCGYLVAAGRRRELATRAFVASGLVVAAMSLVWLVPAALRVGIGPLWETLRHEVIERGVPQSPWQLVAHVAGFPVEVLAATAPFSLLLLALARSPVRERLRARYGAAYQFAVWAVLLNFIPYWVRGSSAVRYFMPMVPTMLVVAAMVFEEWTEHGPKVLPAATDELAGRAVEGAVRAAFVLAALLAISAAMPSWLYGKACPLPWLVVVGLVGAVSALGPVIARMGSRQPRLALAAVVVLAMVALRLTTFTFWIVEKAEHNEQMAEKMARIQAAVVAGGEGPVVAVGPLPPAVWFYAPAGLLRAAAASNDGDGAGLPTGSLPVAGAFAEGYFLYADARVSSDALAAEEPWERVLALPFKREKLVLARRLR